MKSKSFLLPIPIFIKNIFDFFLGVNPISSTSTLVFTFFSLPYIWRNKWYLASVLLFIPALFIDFLSFRLIVTFSLFFIFFHFIKSNDEYISNYLIYLVCFLSLAIILGLLVPSYYTEYADLYKYKFIYNDPNNFGPYASAYLAILIYFSVKLKDELKNILLICLILGLYFTIIQIKGRLYGAIGTAEMLIFFYFLKQKSISKKVFFAGSVLFSLLAGYWLYQIGFITKAELFHNEITQAKPEIQTNSCRDITSLTGRDALWKAFFEHIDKTPLSELLYGSTYASYEPIAFKSVPNSTHSYVENSYYTVILFGGYLALIIIILLEVYLLYILYRRGVRVTLAFVLLYYAVFFFDDSFIYPISVFHQLLSIFALYHYELSYAKKS